MPPAAPYLALLDEPDPSLRTYALQALNNIVGELWAEIANNIAEIEELSEDASFEGRHLAALVASKVYYNLGDYDSSVRFALAAGELFDAGEDSEFAETIVSKCIEQYIAQSRAAYTDGLALDPRLEAVFRKMMAQCLELNLPTLAIGVALESYRMDSVEAVISQHPDQAQQLVAYACSCLLQVAYASLFRAVALRRLAEVLLALPSPDYFLVARLVVQLNDAALCGRVFESISDPAVACQVAFDLVQAGSQELLLKTIALLDKSIPLNAKLARILSGVPLCDYDITFLRNQNSTDVKVLNTTKASLDGKSLMFHNAILFMNAFLHAGTTDDSFLRNNLNWLGKSSNWSKFTATAALGVIHKGNLSQGRAILLPYLPEKAGLHYTQGGSLYALGLIFAGHGAEVVDYLKGHIVEKGASAGTEEVDAVLHGACLGAGVAAMGTADDALYEELKSVMYLDLAVSGEAAALGVGLVMLGLPRSDIGSEMVAYARETQHENIIRGAGLAMALMCFGRQEQAEESIEELLKAQNANLRYGGCFAVALAYCGTGDKAAIKKLLHVAVSDLSNDVRRAAVIGLGFVLIRDYKTVPAIVELLAELYNPHVRYGTAIALGVACAGKGNFSGALDLLEPLTKDPVDFVRQGALIATALVVIQLNEKLYPDLGAFKERLLSVVSSKGQEGLAKFGAALAMGIVDAGGRNVTVNLENAHTGTLNVKAVVGLALFLQSWYWFPMAHFLLLSFTPTTIVGVTEDLRMPKFTMACSGRKLSFAYPPKLEDVKEERVEKVERVILSTTGRRGRGRKEGEKEKDKGDKMDIDVDEKKQDKKKDEEGEKMKEEEEEAEEDEGFLVENLTRVLPAQLKHISFVEGRWVPAREFKNSGGVVVLKDTKPGEKTEYIRTVRQLSNTEAPVPEEFILAEDERD